MPLTRPSIVAVFAATALALTACGADDNANADTSGAGSSISASPDDAAQDLYNDALDDLEIQDFIDGNVTADRLIGDFQYSVAVVASDGPSALLVKAVGDEFSAIKAFVPSDDYSRLMETGKVFHDGAASAGGSRMALEANSDGGLLATSSQSASGQTETDLWVFNGSEMEKSGQSWDYRIDQPPADLESIRTTIDWTDIDDRSGLGTVGTGGNSGDSSGSDSGPNPTLGAQASPGVAAGGTTTDNGGQIGGDCGQINGATVTAGSSTSCGFAVNVATEAFQPIYTDPSPGYGDPTVTSPPGIATVTASSPATGSSITMDCFIGTDGRALTCYGGENAEVIVRTDSGSFLNLVVN